MNTCENEGEINVKLKQVELNDGEPGEIAAAVDIQHEESPPAIFKLNAICCDDLFEWLSLQDLHSLGQTCKRMQRLTGLYFQENFKDIEFICGNEQIYYEGIQLDGFMPFFQRIQIRNDTDQAKTHIASTFDSLRHISLITFNFTADMLDCIKDKLGKIETIQLIGAVPSIIWFGDLLNCCQNLKTLRFEQIGSPENDWMLSFLQRIQQLQHLEISKKILLHNRDILINSELKLDELTLQYDHESTTDLHDVLNQLYDKGFYKRLLLKCYRTYSVHWSVQMNVISTFPGLEAVSGKIEENTVLPTITGLKELAIQNINLDEIDLEALAVSFPNLRQVYLFNEATIEKLIPFVRRLRKLKELGILLPTFDGSQLDLTTLNEERKKLAGACKLTIYLQEKVYLQTKMATKNLYANHDLIEIKRIESSNMRPTFQT